MPPCLMTIVINKHVMGGYQVLFPLSVAVYASLHLTLMVPPGGGVVIPLPEGEAEARSGSRS